MKTVDYATIVTPDEMQDARQWLADMLESLKAEDSPHAATIVIGKAPDRSWGLHFSHSCFTACIHCLRSGAFPARFSNGRTGTPSVPIVIVARNRAPIPPAVPLLNVGRASMPARSA